MKRASRFLHVLFCICCTAAIAAIISWNGYAMAALALLAILAVLRRRTIPHFTLLLFLSGLLLRLWINSLLQPGIYSDYLLFYNAAMNLLLGNTETIVESAPAYFSSWAYQSGIVMWEKLWLRFWKDPMCLKLVHAVLSAGIACLVYRLLLGWVSRAAAQAASLLLSIFPFFLTYHVVLSNSIPSVFFFTLGLWILVSADCGKLGFWRWPLAGMMIEAGNILRCEGIILLVCVAAWAVFACVRRPETVKKVLPGVVTLLAVTVLVHASADTYLKVTGLNPNGLANLVPEWKFVVGLNDETNGGYSEDDSEILWGTLDENDLPTQQTHEVLHSMIRERLCVGPDRLLDLLNRKLNCLWNMDALYETHIGVETDIHERSAFSELNNRARASAFDRGLFFIALGLTVLGLWGKGWQEQYPTEAYLPFFVFFSTFCAMLFVEVQPRYAYLPQIYLFAASAFGLDRLLTADKQHRRGPFPVEQAPEQSAEPPTQR